MYTHTTQEVVPLIVCIGGGVVVCVYSCFRHVLSSPDIHMASYKERTMTVRDNFEKGSNHSAHVARYRKMSAKPHFFFANSVVPDSYKTQARPRIKSIFS